MTRREEVVKAVLRIIWITLDNLVEISVYCTFMLLLYVFKWIWPSFYQEFDSWLFREILRTIGYWVWTAGYEIVEYGDSPYAYQNERCLVIVNHQTTADVPVLCSTICRKGAGGGKTSWVLDSMFKWSNFGVVSNIRGDFFITQGKKIRADQATKLAEHMRKEYWARDRRWFVIFPEGGFLHKRRDVSQKYSRDNGFPMLTHCTLPRLGGVRTMLDTANPVRRLPSAAGTTSADGKAQQNKSTPTPPGPGFRFLIDVTIAYPDGYRLGMDDIAFGNRPPCEIGIHYRRIPIEDVPHQNEVVLRDFLYQLWVDKEAKLAHFNQHGHFAGIPRQDGVVVEYHMAGLVFNHAMFLVFFIFLTYFVYLPLYHYICTFLRG